MEGLRSWRNGIALLVGSIALLMAAAPAPAFFIRGGTRPRFSKIPSSRRPSKRRRQHHHGPAARRQRRNAPTGTAEPPTNPPQATPEPASLVSAVIGVGLALGYAWRKRGTRFIRR